MFDRIKINIGLYRWIILLSVGILIWIPIITIPDRAVLYKFELTLLSILAFIIFSIGIYYRYYYKFDFFIYQKSNDNMVEHINSNIEKFYYNIRMKYGYIKEFYNKYYVLLNKNMDNKID
jgi:hypothetical protein